MSSQEAPPRLRQLVIVARSLDTADTLKEVLGLGEPFPDPGVAEFGLVNAVFAVGDQFLEVIVPTTEKAPGQRFIDRNGEGGYMAIFQTGDLAALRQRVDSLGMRRVWNIDLPDISASHIHPADIGGAIVSVDEPRPAGSWRWGGPGWRERASKGKFTGAVLEAPDPDALARKWGLALGLTPDRRRLFLADAVIEFREGPVERLAEFGLDVPDTEDALARATGAGLGVDGTAIDVAGVRLALS
ncbi:MAG: VOC family protein [Hyphomonas sp.]